MAEMNNLQSNL